MSRIGRSLENLLAIVAECDRRGVDIAFLDEQWDTSNATGRLLFRIMAAVQAYQAELTQEDVIEGLERARERRGGTLPPRGLSFTDRQRREAEEMLRNTILTVSELSRLCRIGVVGLSGRKFSVSPESQASPGVAGR